MPHYKANQCIERSQKHPKRLSWGNILERKAAYLQKNKGVSEIKAETEEK